MSQASTQTPKWLLDYIKCSLQELRTFIDNRTGSAVDARELLTAHLCRMDQTKTFPRFIELPPELRINIHEALLVKDRARDQKGWLVGNEDCELHTAVLRTWKQIYSEAMPILYSQNKFSVGIGYTRESHHPAGNRECVLRIAQPGHKLSFHTTAMQRGRGYPGWRSFYGKPPLNMLRTLKHLTVNLGLVMPRDSYPAEACEAVAALCLVLAGTCKLESLTIKLGLEDSRAGDTDLAGAF
jgi:hypothetical protein